MTRRHPWIGNGVLLHIVVTSTLVSMVQSSSLVTKIDSYEAKSQRAHRHKRSFLFLYITLHCAVPHLPLAGGMTDYGCFCGIGGSGEPVDGIDKCCQAHDKCYDKIKKDASCKDLVVYLASYKTFPCNGGQMKCKPESHPDYPASDPMNVCRRKLCECDVNFGKCLQAEKYHKGYERYPQDLCSFTDPQTKT